LAGGLLNAIRIDVAGSAGSLRRQHTFLTQASVMNTVEFVFPEGLRLPELLEQMVAELPSLFEPGAEVSGYFSFRPELPGNVAHWFARPVTASALRAARHLGVFGCGPDGSLLAVWKAPGGGLPVVCLGSEGDTQVLASCFSEFLRLLGIGYAELGAGSYEDPPNEDGESPEASLPLRTWLAHRGLSVPSTGEDIVSAATQAHPDFYGWCEDANHDKLDGNEDTAVASHAPPPAPADTEPMGDLWTRVIDVIGKPVTSPEVRSLLQTLGARPLNSTHPKSSRASVTTKLHGIEISANCRLKYRPCWPPRREGRVYLTYVHRIYLAAGKYLGPLPAGLHWDRSSEQGNDWPSPREDVDVKFSFQSRQPGLEAIVISLREERDYITASESSEESRPLVHVEGAFFATWCALQGLLMEDRFSGEVLAAWRDRTRTPLALLHGPCGRLLWSDDIQPEFQPFVSTYYRGHGVRDGLSWNSDLKQVFGASNHFRGEDETMTPDSWEAFDRIATRIDERFRQWRAGTLKSEDE
jgi:hypothetical protein